MRRAVCNTVITQVGAGAGSAQGPTLGRLVEALPRIRRRVDECLDAQTACREYALAAVIKLVDATAIRAGGENSARETEARGATTLQKSDVTTPQGSIRLAFTGKGGKQVTKDIYSPRLLAAIKRLRRLPGRRLFQYRDAEGNIRRVRAAEVNAFLRDLSGRRISLKDFRTDVRLHAGPRGARADPAGRQSTSPSPTDARSGPRCCHRAREYADDLPQELCRTKLSSMRSRTEA